MSTYAQLDFETLGSRLHVFLNILKYWPIWFKMVSTQIITQYTKILSLDRLTKYQYVINIKILIPA